MTKEKAKHLAEIFNAYSEGKTIEVFLDLEWGEVPSDGYSFDVEKESYRIKKTPTYRPFKNAEECFEEIKKHQPVGWLHLFDKSFIQITKIKPKPLRIECDGSVYFCEELLKMGITFADGKPFGIKE